MEDCAFDDLFEEVGLLQDSSSESLTMPPIETIRMIFTRIADSLANVEDGISVTLQLRPKTRKQLSQHIGQSRGNAEQTRSRTLRFPGKTADEAWRFTVVTRILELMYDALRTGVVISKRYPPFDPLTSAQHLVYTNRDIYYRDPALFASQTYVDRYVDDIAYTLNVSRSQLNVTAAAKGLMAGAARFCRRDGSCMDISGEREGTLVPSLRDIVSVDMHAVKWILVIEKEATFRSIAASGFWHNVVSEGVLITGKGYPDLSTRAMLRYMSTPTPSNAFSSVPVYAMVDCDPDGLAILSVYKNSSIALAHEGANLCVPQLCWLGLRLEQLDITSKDLHTSQGVMRLTERDRKKAKKMLESCDDEEMASALQQMLSLNLKAELQILDASADGMVKLLRTQLF